MEPNVKHVNKFLMVEGLIKPVNVLLLIYEDSKVFAYCKDGKLFSISENDLFDTPNDAMENFIRSMFQTISAD